MQICCCTKSSKIERTYLCSEKRSGEGIFCQEDYFLEKMFLPLIGFFLQIRQFYFVRHHHLSSHQEVMHHKKLRNQSNDSSIIVFSLSLLQGLRTGWLASVMAVSLKSDSTYPVNEDNITCIVIAEHVGQIVFVVFFSLFIAKLGRKKILLASNILLVVGWWCLYGSDSFVSIIVAQLIISAGSALFEVIACTYIGELTSPRNRTILLTIALLFASVGTELQFVLQLFDNYHLLSLVPLIVAIISLAVSPSTMLESPYHLIVSGEQEEAMRILSSLYEDESSIHVMMLYEDLQKYAEIENTPDEIGYLRFFSTIMSDDTKTFVFICTVYSVMHVSTPYVFFTFGPLLMAPYTNELSVDFVMNLIGSLTVVCAIVTPFIVDTASRNFLLASGFGSTALFQFTLGMLFWLEGFGGEKIAVLPSIIVTLIAVLVILHNLAVSPAVQISRAELFPHAMRIRGNCVMIVCKEIASALSRGLFLPSAANVGIGSTFVFYAIVAFAAFHYVCSFHKKTEEDKSLADIRYIYKI